MPAKNLIIPLLFLLTGFISAYLIFSPSTENRKSINNRHTHNDAETTEINRQVVNPFVVKNNNPGEGARLEALEAEISRIKEQLQALTITLQEQVNISASQSKSNLNVARPARSNMRTPSMLNQRLYNLDNLLRGGIDQALAEDIVRRKNSIELKMLALQDRAKRENYLNTQRYYNELEALEQSNINLREELGEDRYDEYLYRSKQNNRIRINSVMLGSAAEQAGILKSDIILSYDNKKLFSWQELKQATAEGTLGEYVSITILRNGQVFSYSVPRGPLGVQLGATRLEP